MVKLKRRAVLLAKIESVYGTDPTPAETDAIATTDISIKPSFEPVERAIQIASMTKLPAASGMRFYEVSFTADLIGSGAMGTAPKLGALFQACAMTQTVATSSVTYTPTSSPISSCTLYVYQDGLRHIVSGCVGSWKLTGEAGKIPQVEFKFNGIYAAATDTAIVTPTFDSTVTTPPVVKSATFSYNSVALIASKFEIDLANTIAKRPSINAAYALAGFHITDRKPIVSFDPETAAVATVDFLGDAVTTTRAVVCTLGTATGNRCVVTVPAVMVTEVDYADRDQTLINNIKGEATGTTDGSELNLKFT